MIKGTTECHHCGALITLYDSWVMSSPTTNGYSETAYYHSTCYDRLPFDPRFDSWDSYLERGRDLEV